MNAETTTAPDYLVGPGHVPNIVLGWDRQRGSAAALAVAADLAQRLDARLHVVHVADTGDMPIDPDAADWEQQINQRLRDDEASARSFLDRLVVDWTYHSAHGQPSEIISNLADETHALMIVVGGQRGGMHSFIGTLAGQSVSRQLTHHHGRPVLVVPPPREEQT
ncbi:universal stress protein [Mycobacterium montefiorense]|uniref:universal stress protein n=1 Tax=Mycobacterium montefiorense TaxID=154654 RepID=UPI0021F3273C|nr:universal stress protein [Mycobacterium montefiorense]MCV7426129.1 universal stress protein [Mycobacterium montefiorense]